MPRRAEDEQQAQAPEALQGLVVELPRPASALGVGGGQGAAQPIALHALGERDRGRGAGGERAQYLLVVLAEHTAVLAAVECGQDAHPSPR